MYMKSVSIFSTFSCPLHFSSFSFSFRAILLLNLLTLLNFSSSSSPPSLSFCPLFMLHVHIAPHFTHPFLLTLPPPTTPPLSLSFCALTNLSSCYMYIFLLILLTLSSSPSHHSPPSLSFFLCPH